jgi:DNA repair protein RecN (Recombination protein N)
VLTCLKIRHLAIVERLEIELAPGLNVVTGETGSGKSILVAALQLVLGARARPELVRTGFEAAEVEALFDLDPEDPARTVLAEEDLADGDQVVLRRIVAANGRSRATVNGRLATAAQLRRIAAALVDVSSQHEHTTLVDPGTHLGYLDAFGTPPALLEAVARAHARASEVASTLAELQQSFSGRAEREDLLRFQVGEIEKLDPKEGEMTALEAERERLRHGERLGAAATKAVALLDDDHGVCDKLRSIGAQLADAGRWDAELAVLGDRVESARAELQEVSYDLGIYLRQLDVDPGRLALVDERIQALKRLLRRFHGDEAAMLAFREAAGRELAGLDDLEHKVERARREVAQALAQAAEAARSLSQRRRSVAEALGTAITGELRDLGMGHARVEVMLEDLPPGDGALAIEGARLTARGVDRAEFLIAPNPGEAPRPLARVASGGELARALLALKRVLAGHGPVGLYVFDEVDTGVGGAVADAIGRKIADVSRHHQVLCITHQPQIAAFGDVHLVVSKEVEKDGRTRSRVERLDPVGRRDELARMLGGATVTDAAREAATALLSAARGGTA